MALTDALVTPLCVRVGFADDSNDNHDDYRSEPSQEWDSSILLTPSVASPYPAPFLHGMPFTPFEETGAATYDDQSARLVLDEGRSQGRVSTKVFASYLKAVGGWKKVLFWVAVLAIWQGLTISGDVWLSRWSATVKDGTASSSADYLHDAGYYLSIYAVFALGSVAMTMVRTLSIFSSGVAASRRLFENMTNALLRAPMRFFDTNPIGRILNRYSNDIDTVDSSIPFNVSASMAVAFMALFSFGTTIWVLQWWGLALLPLIYLYFVLGGYYVEPAREMERVNKTTKSPLLNLISESIEGALVIRAFGPKQVRRFQRQHFRNVDTNNEASFAAQVISQWFAMRIQLLSAILLLCISTALIFMRDYVSPGLIGLVLNYSFTVLPSFQQLVANWGQLETAMVGPERLAEYANIEPEAPRVISGAVAKDWPTTGDVAFTNMSFRYKENDPMVLKDVNVHIQSGEKVGIVGRTGAGKSSLTMA
ncbi:hypothetical protein H257_19497, partial [Aphanomyces astaci]